MIFLSHMGREHASREKKLPMVNFFIFVQKNVSTIRFQEIKIRPLKGFEKFAFCFFAHYKISPSTSEGQKYPPEVQVQHETCSSICGTHVQAILNKKNWTGLAWGVREGQNRSKWVKDP